LGSYVAELYSKQEEPEEAFNVLMQLMSYHPQNYALHLQMATIRQFPQLTLVRITTIRQMAP